jgi:predicted MFS family arabinose efflux permease
VAVQVAVSTIAMTYPTLAPYLQADLGLSLAAVGLFNTYTYLGTMVGAVPSGWLTDQLGSRRVLVGGALLSGAMAVAVPILAYQAVAFMGLLLVLGLVASTATPAGSQAVARAFPPQRRGMAIGLRQMGVPLGGALAAALLPWLAHLGGWRVAAAAGGGVALLAALLAWWWYRESVPVTPARPRTTARQPGWSLLLRDRNILLAAGSGMVLPTGQFVMLTYLILYLQNRYGFSELQGAALLTAANLAGAFSRVIWSSLSDRLSARRLPLLVGVVVLAALSALLLAVLPATLPSALLSGVVLLYGATALGWQGLHFSLLTELSPPGWEGRVTGLGLVFTSIGIASAPPLFGLVVDLSGSYTLGWLLLAGVLGLGAGVLSRVRERPRVG